MPRCHTTPPLNIESDPQFRLVIIQAILSIYVLCVAADPIGKINRGPRGLRVTLMEFLKLSRAILEIAGGVPFQVIVIAKPVHAILQFAIMKSQG